MGDTRRQLRDGGYRIAREERNQTFGELMEQFLKAYVIKKASQRSYMGYVKRMHRFLADGTRLAVITLEWIVEGKISSLRTT